MTSHMKYHTACENSCVRSFVVLGGALSSKLLKWHPLSISAWAWKLQISDTKPLSQIGCVEKKTRGYLGAFSLPLFKSSAHKGITMLQIKCLLDHWRVPEIPLPCTTPLWCQDLWAVFYNFNNFPKPAIWRSHQLYAVIGKVWKQAGCGLSQAAKSWMPLRSVQKCRL